MEPTSGRTNRRTARLTAEERASANSARALKILEGLFDHTVAKVTNKVLEREEALSTWPEDYAWEESEERLAMKAVHQGQLIAALQSTLDAPMRRETKVEVLTAVPETLETRINERINQHRAWTVSTVQLQALEDGMMLAMLTLVRDVPVERRPSSTPDTGARR